MLQSVILCVDDEPAVLESLKIELRRGLGQGYLIETAESSEEALQVLDDLQLRHQDVAVVIADYLMPNMRGDELLQEVHRRSPETLKIMLTGQTTVEAIASVVNSAQLYRYISKPWESHDLLLTLKSALAYYRQQQLILAQEAELRRVNEELKRLVEDQSAIIQDRTFELERANRQLHRLANTDSLTDIPNRRFFDEKLQQEWSICQREQQYLTLIFADVDYFKAYNDTYGHQEGDVCLRLVAKSMQTALKRPRDLVARYGGEEFVLLLPNTETGGACAVIAEIQQRIRDLSIPHSGSKVSGWVTVSFGGTVAVPLSPHSPSELLQIADLALYDAKEQGRNGYVFREFP
jgi:diguanylate cyclase (GGDEF)-like protein